MLGHEGRDEIIAMIVARLHADRRFLSGALARLDQQLGLELPGQKSIGIALVDEQIGQSRAGRDQRAGVVGTPGLAILAQIARPRLFAPRSEELRVGKEGVSPGRYRW